MTAPFLPAPAGTSLHECQWAVSHNSYEHKPFDPEAIYQAGYRGVEMDLVQKPGFPEWCCKHGGHYSAAAPQLRALLKTLHTWSMGRQAGNVHEPMWLHLDCKDTRFEPGFAEQLDDCIRAEMPNQPLFTPMRIMQGAASLVKAAMKRGWPTWDSLPGHFIIVLTGERAAGERYISRAPEERLCFTDRSGSFGFPTDKGHRVIANGDVAHVQDNSGFGKWTISKRGILWRLYLATTPQEFESMAALKPNMVAADFPLQLPAAGYWLR